MKRITVCLLSVMTVCFLLSSCNAISDTRINEGSYYSELVQVEEMFNKHGHLIHFR